MANAVQKTSDMGPVAAFVASLPEDVKATAVRMFNAGGEGVALSIARDLLTAADEDALFGETTVEDWTGGLVLKVTDVKLNESGPQFVNDDTIFPVYAVVTGITDDGEDIIVTHGGTNVVAQLISAVRLGLLPVRLMMTVRKTRQGFDVTKLVKAAGDF
jgi:hypothetical protein